MDDVDAVLRDPRWAPRWGWHDDHRAADRTSAYLPAIQQVRSEFYELLTEIVGLLGGRCLQLGMGECDASHAVWRKLFKTVITIDLRVIAVDSKTYPGANIRDHTTWNRAAGLGLYDFLFIDAGHSFEDARLDHLEYGALVKPGGIIAFHDALKRTTYEDEIQVWRYLETLPGVNMIGAEVGVAWIIKET